jgi:iron complex transport system substrate-binding protein
VRASPIAGEPRSSRQRRLFGEDGHWLACLVLVFAAGAAAGCRERNRGGDVSGGGARVVSLHDVTTEIVVALGAVDRLVGVAGGVQLPADVARAVAGVPEVGGAESIVAVRPTVVLGTDVVAERSPELVSFLRGRGIEVWLASPARLEEVFDTVAQVARRVGEAARGRTLVDGLKARVAAVRPAPGAGPPVPVFVYDCCDPAFTAAGRTVLTDCIARAGGRNIFADLDADWTKVSWEEVVARQPRLVVVHDYRYGDQADVAGKRAKLQAIRALGTLPTTVLPLGLSLGGIRSIEALERLAPIIAQAATP